MAMLLSRTQWMKFVLCIMIVITGMSSSANTLFSTQILESCIAGTTHYDKKDTHLTAVTTRTKSILDASEALVFFLIGPVLGAVSDVYGRKPVFIFCFIVGVAQYAFQLVGVYYLSLWAVIVGKILTFSVLGTYSVAFAYATDICTFENKPRFFGYILGSLGVGMTVAPLALGELGKRNLEYPMLVGFCLYIIATFIAVFLLPESLHYDIVTECYVESVPKRKMPPLKRLLNPFSSLTLIFNAKMADGKSRNWFIFWLSVIYGLIYTSMYDTVSTLTLFVQWRFGFGPLQISWMTSCEGVAMLISQFLLLGLTLRFLGKRNGFLMACVISAVGHALFMLSYYNIYLLGVAIAVTGMGRMASAICKTLVSDRIPKEKQGAALGGMYSLTSIAQVVGDLVFENAFAYFISPTAIVFIPGVQFLMGSFLYVCIIVIAVIIFVVYPESKEADLNSSTDDVKTTMYLDGADEIIEVASEKTRLIN